MVSELAGVINPSVMCHRSGDCVPEIQVATIDLARPGGVQHTN